jgi:hypothetical protein
MSEPAVDATVGDDGTLHVPADQLASRGVRAGDRVRVVRVAKRRIRSMLGAHARDVRFTDDHLREVRRDMGKEVGEDLTR